MKHLLVSIDAKYIHTNLAVRLLKVNSHNMDVDILEFTIKDTVKNIVKSIIDSNADTVGFSCYIWNIEIIKKVIPLLRDAKKDVIIILGGPEVSFNPKDYVLDKLADYVISGDGEHAYQRVIFQLQNNAPVHGIHGVTYRTEYNDIDSIAPKYEKTLDLYRTAYDLAEDKDKLKDRVNYIELSRGCPYRCGFCVSSTDKSVRYFSVNTVKKALKYLLDNGAKTIKFLDRTFNTNKHYTLEILKFLVEHHRPGVKVQFEIVADTLEPEVVQYIQDFVPKNYIRFEIGIQDINEDINAIIDRKQDLHKTYEVVKQLHKKNVIDIHLDLIAGLPGQTLKHFIASFDEVFKLYAAEIQVGFLKVLKGTKVELIAEEYGIKYNEKAPYQVKSTSSMSAADLKKIKYVEEMVHKIWNKDYLRKTIRHYISKDRKSPFEFFYDMGHYLDDNVKNYKEAQVDIWYSTLVKYFKKIGVKDLDELEYFIKKDYLLRSKVKPKIWYKKLDKEYKNMLIKKKLSKLIKEHNSDTLYKYANIIESKDKIFVILYLPDNKHPHYEFEK